MDLIHFEEKKDLCKRMAVNLPALRAKVGLSQNDLADRLGFSRQTICAIENEKREMQWSTFSTMALYFARDKELADLMVVMGILTTPLEDILSAESKNMTKAIK